MITEDSLLSSIGTPAVRYTRGSDAVTIRRCKGCTSAKYAPLLQSRLREDWLEDAQESLPKARHD